MKRPRFPFVRFRAWTLPAALLLGCAAPAVVPDETVHHAATSHQAPAIPPAAPADGEPDDGFLGVVVAQEVIDVGPEADGYLSSVAVRVGDRVQRGTALATLETADLEQSLAIATATVRSTEAALQQARIELQRAEDRLNRRTAVPDLFSAEEVASTRSERQLAQAAYEAAAAKVAQEEAHRIQLIQHLSRSVLRSPIDGEVALRYLDPGSLVHSGQAVVRLLSADSFLVRFAVPPEQAAEIHGGRPVEIHLRTPSRVLAGRVSQITPRIDPASQMIFVEAAIEASAARPASLQDGLVSRVVLR